MSQQAPDSRDSEARQQRRVRQRTRSPQFGSGGTLLMDESDGDEGDDEEVLPPPPLPVPGGAFLDAQKSGNSSGGPKMPSPTTALRLAEGAARSLGLLHGYVPNPFASAVPLPLAQQQPVRLPESATDDMRMAAMTAYAAANPSDPFVAHYAFGRVYALDTFESTYNPLIEGASLGNVLGRGAFGAVIELFPHVKPTHTHPSAVRRYALKIQSLLTFPTEAEMALYVEPGDVAGQPLSSNTLAQRIVELLWEEARIKVPQSDNELALKERAERSIMNTVTAQNELAVCTLLASLRHPNVVRMYDWVRVVGAWPALDLDRGLYQMMVLEHSDSTLAQAITHYVPSLPDTQRQYEFMGAVLAQCLCALEQLRHAVGLTHGDFHAQNVLLQQQPWIAGTSRELVYELPEQMLVRVPLVHVNHALVKFTDFGFARASYIDQADGLRVNIAPVREALRLSMQRSHDTHTLLRHVRRLVSRHCVALHASLVWTAFCRRVDALFVRNETAPLVLLRDPMFQQWVSVHGGAAGVVEIPRLRRAGDKQQRRYGVGAIVVPLPSADAPLGIVHTRIASALC